MEQDDVPVDATTLIYLAKTDSFEIARLCVRRLLVPPGVWREAVDEGERSGYADASRIRPLEATGFLRRIELDAEQERRAGVIATAHRLGTGESEALAIARPGGAVFVDDARAARVAASFGLVALSTLFLPVLGRRRGCLDTGTAHDLLRRLAIVSNARAETVYEIEKALKETE